MDRGTEALDARMKRCQKVEVSQSLRGIVPKLWGLSRCEAQYEFKYYANGRQVAHSLEESEACSRNFCQPCYAWTMLIRDVEAKAELLTVHRPCSCPLLPFKCCCYQIATVSSGGHHLGRVREDVYYGCIPSFSIYNDSNEHVYTLYPSTCCWGTCVDCCAEGHPCSPAACCRVPFWIYPAAQFATDGPVPSSSVGKVVKLPNDLSVELFTDAHAFEVEFPPSATTNEKAVLIGTSVYFNSLFFGAKITDVVDVADLSASLLECA
jgi:Scramblase